MRAHIGVAEGIETLQYDKHLGSCFKDIMYS